ncbi:MAG: hypothetical protein ACI4UC_01990 [Alloprevotella sp.]
MSVEILGMSVENLGMSDENLGDIGQKLRLLSLQSGHLQKTFPTFVQTNACSSGAHFLFFVNCAPINSVKAWRRPAKMLLLQSNFRASVRNLPRIVERSRKSERKLGNYATTENQQEYHQPLQCGFGQVFGGNRA